MAFGLWVSRRQVSTECVLLVSSWVEHLTRLRLVGVSAEYVASVMGKVGALVGGACTLLGPEGPGADRGSSGLWLVAVPRGPSPAPVFRWWGWVPPVL